MSKMALVLAILALTLASAIPGVAAVCNGDYTSYYPNTMAINNVTTPFYVNDTYGVNFGDGVQYILCANETTALCYADSTDYQCYNDDTQTAMWIESGNESDYGTLLSDSNIYIYYTTNATSGTTINDMSGNGLDGTLTGASPSISVNGGKIQHGFNLPATDDYLLVSSSATETHNKLIMSIWVKPSCTISPGSDCDPGNDNGDRLYRFPAYEDIFIDFTSGKLSQSGWCDDTELISTTSTWTSGQWYNIIYAFDTDEDTAEMWINGIKEDTCDSTVAGLRGMKFASLIIAARPTSWGGILGVYDNFLVISNQSYDDSFILGIYNNTNPDGYSVLGASVSTGSAPYYTNPKQPTTPRTFPNGELVFNVTWSDDSDVIDTGTIEHNFTGTMTTYAMTNVTDTWNYTLDWNFSAGSYSYRYIANNTAGTTNQTDYYVFVLDKADAEINLSLNGTSANLSLTFLQTANLSAWTNISGVSPTLQRNGTSISIPTVYNPGYGYYNITAYLSHENYTASSVTYWMSVAKASSGLTLTASPAWTAAEETTVTITCANTRGLSMTLTRDGVTVSNPYSATHDYDNYAFNCTVSDTYNYTPFYSANTLVITSGGFGCTNTETFAFETNVTVPAGNTSIVLDFSSLVDDYLVRSDLGDVYPVINTSPAGWYNTTYDDLFIVNTTGYEGLEISIRFGNAIVDYNYTAAANSTDELAYTYSVINEYMRLTFIDERTGSVQLPPGANHTLFIFCTGGISSHNISAEHMTVATFVQADEIKAQVQYSVTEIYSRNYVIDADVETKNVYLVDADEDQVVQIILSLQDATGDFDESLLVAKKYIEANQRTITEHYFDAESKVIIYLINGDKYTLFVDNGVEERSVGYLYVDSVDLSKTITIGEVLTTNQTLGNLSFGLYNTSDTIIFAYVDASGQTSSAEMWIYNATNTSELLYYVNSTNHSIVSFSYTVADTNQTYLVKVKVHHNTFGLNSIDLNVPFFYPSFSIPSPWSIMDDAGMVGDLPGGISWANLIGVLAVIGAALLFTNTTGPLGGIIAAIAASVFLVFGWWSVDIVIVAVALVLAFINKLTEDRRPS